MTSPATTSSRSGTCRTVVSSLSVEPTSTITSSCPSSVKRLSGTVTAVTGDGGMIPAYTLSHSSGRAAALRLHLRDRARRGDDARAEPLGEQSGGEPVIAVAVGDEDVGQVPTLARRPSRQALAPDRSSSPGPPAPRPHVRRSACSPSERTASARRSEEHRPAAVGR